MFQRDIAPGDGHETAESRLTGQEIVTGLVEAGCGNIVADGEQFALGGIEKPHVHSVRQLPNVNDQLLRYPQGFAGQPLRGGKGCQQSVEPGAQR